MSTDRPVLSIGGEYEAVLGLWGGPHKLKHVTFKKCMSYRFKVIIMSPFAKTTQKAPMPSNHIGHRPLTVAVESRRGLDRKSVV